ncbi:hypothetical protein [Leifsonia sp. Leaf336]|uniref:hypothetical protein n=1 Tax=Leifsonia sp. Leaf336 TaxID=1736341 RepID=UPI000A540B9C|nr:hypothetical protein [Leifsonia sp. Leaf336]
MKNKQHRFDRFPTDEWEARSSRGFFLAFATFVALVPMYFFGMLFDVQGPFWPAASAFSDWMLLRYVSVSREFGWLLPLVFGALVAFGVWTRLGTALSRQERRELALRQAGLALVAAATVWAATGAVVAQSKQTSLSAGTLPVLLALLVILITCVEVGRITPRIPLKVQRKNTKREISRLRRQVEAWTPEEAKNREPRWVVVAVAMAIVMVIGAIVLVGAVSQASSVEKVIVIVGGAVLGCGMRWRRGSSVKYAGAAAFAGVDSRFEAVHRRHDAGNHRARRCYRSHGFHALSLGGARPHGRHGCSRFTRDGQRPLDGPTRESGSRRRVDDRRVD